MIHCLIMFKNAFTIRMVIMQEREFEKNVGIEKIIIYLIAKSQ